MSQDLVLSQISDGILAITLNRPDVLNSFNDEMAKSLQAALATASQDPVRVVTLTGSGRAFCAGQDLSTVSPDARGHVPDLGRIVKENYNPIISAIRNLEKPVICAVNGTAAGAGANLAFACDIVVAADNASFIQSFSKVGLIPDSGGTFFLPRLVGLARATALTFLGDKVSAEDARALGLIYKVVPAAELQQHVRQLAAQFASAPTKGFGLTKRAFNQSFTHNLSDQLALEERLQREAGHTHDYVEGVRAFLEKRKAEFTGK